MEARSIAWACDKYTEWLLEPNGQEDPQCGWTSEVSMLAAVLKPGKDGKAEYRCPICGGTASVYPA